MYRAPEEKQRGVFRLVRSAAGAAKIFISNAQDNCRAADWLGDGYTQSARCTCGVLVTAVAAGMCILSAWMTSAFVSS